MFVFPHTAVQWEAECPSKNINCGSKRMKNNSVVDWEIQEQTWLTILKCNETRVFLFDHCCCWTFTHVHISSDLETIFMVLYNGCVLHLKYIQYMSQYGLFWQMTLYCICLYIEGDNKSTVLTWVLVTHQWITVERGKTQKNDILYIHFSTITTVHVQQVG
jgi:hypothetical protein